jgi:hypothetical protein
MTQATPPTKSSGPLILTILVLILLILHQDNWFWTDGTLVLGFLPIGLFWHACISLAAAGTWFLATKIAWPLGDAAVDDRGAQQTTADASAEGGNG